MSEKQNTVLCQTLINASSVIAVNGTRKYQINTSIHFALLSFIDLCSQHDLSPNHTNCFNSLQVHVRDSEGLLLFTNSTRTLSVQLTSRGLYF